MIIEITYKQMSYLRSLLQKDNPHEFSIDEESRKILLAKLLQLEKDCAAGRKPNSQPYRSGNTGRACMLLNLLKG